LSICSQSTPTPTGSPTTTFDRPTPAIEAEESPTGTPTNRPTESPTNKPTRTPTDRLTESPTNKPTGTPTNRPTESPTNNPTETSTRVPTRYPTNQPTLEPIAHPKSECVWPEGDFSAITDGDLISGAHSAYHHIAVGGKLKNPSNSQMVVNERVYGGSWEGRFNFNGGVEKINDLNDVPAIDFAHYEWLARNMKSSEANGKKVIVKNSGRDGSRNGCYDLYDFRPGGQGYDNGNTLVVFNTTDDICLTKTRDGRQFGPSVLAPFSKVTLIRAGFIDGTVIAKEFTTVDGSYLGTELQLHGSNYNGPIKCIETPVASPTNKNNDAQEQTDGECNCGTNNDSDQTFRCGNNIFVCPNVEKVCSMQSRAKSKYYSLTQEECDTMKNVDIGGECISLPRHGINKRKRLGSRVCYGSSDDNGISNDGDKCKNCIDSVMPMFEN